MMKVVKTGSTIADLYISLTVAIVVGRIAAGAARAFLFAKGTYSMAMWVSAYVITSWPGTLIQFIFIPMIIYALMRAHIIEERYPDDLA